MLILSRKPRQKIMIGDSIVVEVLGVHGSQVRIGISAPDDMKILREELVERHEREMQEAG